MSPIYEPRPGASFSTPDAPPDIALPITAPSSDEALIRGLASGRTQGFAAFYERFAPTLFSLACRILRDDKEAEGVLQRALVQMSRHSSSFDSTRGSLFSWAVMITRSQALDCVRQKRHGHSKAAAPETSGAASNALRPARPSASAARSDHERVTAALEALPPQQREALELGFFGGMTPHEISDRLEVPLDAVKTDLRVGLLSVRDAAARRTESAIRQLHPTHRQPAAANSTTQETKNMMSSPPRNEGSEAESFDSFVEKNFPPVYRFAFCMSLAPEAAARLTNAAFAQARRAQQHGTHPALSKQWLLTTVHHDWLGGGSRQSASVKSEPARGPTALLGAQHVADFDEAVVLKALHEMDEKLRLVLSLFYFEKLGYGEIAVILELPPATVLADLAEAKTVLREHLEGTRIGDQSRSRPRVSATIESPGG